jgi:hypothetical protein
MDDLVSCWMLIIIECVITIFAVDAVANRLVAEWHDTIQESASEFCKNLGPVRMPVLDHRPSVEGSRIFHLVIIRPSNYQNDDVLVELRQEEYCHTYTEGPDELLASMVLPDRLWYLDAKWANGSAIWRYLRSRWPGVNAITVLALVPGEFYFFRTPLIVPQLSLNPDCSGAVSI